jgi:hypothetical protein
MNNNQMIVFGLVGMLLTAAAMILFT